MATRVILETVSISDEGYELNTYQPISGTRVISLDGSGYYEQSKVHRSDTDTEIRRYSGPEVGIAPLYEYNNLSKEEYNKYRVAKIDIQRSYENNFITGNPSCLQPEQLRYAIRMLNNFNLMRPDEFIVSCAQNEIVDDDFDSIDQMGNDSIFVTNYGKMLKIVGGHSPRFELYDFDFKIEEKYYNTFYDIEDNAVSEEECTAEYCSFILTLKQDTIAKQVVNFVPVNGIAAIIATLAA